MAASNSSNVPQGFSIYQPALGAQLQFFPAVGTQELDQLVHAFIPGSASIQEKRASVALDFFEHVQLTGESFKFYPVYFMTTPVESPVTASPVQDAGFAACFNESPVMSNWDWSQISTATSQASSSRRRQSTKAPVSRHQTAADFSHMPGMKIMTKEGLDVTNSASRGSKTKEQRDHAHLMRIIKACDSCRRKKVRCDPSHKKRSVAAQPAQKSAAKKTKTKAAAPQAQIANPVIVENDFSTSFNSFDIDASFASTDLSNVSPAVQPLESWEDLIQYPAPAIPEDYDFFADPQSFFSSPESLTMSASSSKPDTPVSQQYQPTGAGLELPDPSLAAPRLPYEQTESIHDYVDFNLYSPASSCSSLSASSPKPSIPDHRQEDPGVDSLLSEPGLLASLDQTQYATTLVGSGFSPAETGPALSSEYSAAMSISRQDYYARVETGYIDDSELYVDVNHNVQHAQSRAGDDLKDQNAPQDHLDSDHDQSDTGELWRRDYSSEVIATSAIAESAITTGGSTVNDSQPLAALAHHLVQQESSGSDIRRDYSQLNIGAIRRTRIESFIGDDTAIATTAIATPAIEAIQAYSTPTAVIATTTTTEDVISTHLEEREQLEILETSEVSEVISASSELEAQGLAVDRHIYPSSSIDAQSLHATSLLLTGSLVSAYQSVEQQSAISWLYALLSVMLMCVALCSCRDDVMGTLGLKHLKQNQFLRHWHKEEAETNGFVREERSRWEALRCGASAVARSVGDMMSQTGSLIAV